jgi:hypothetical protein
MEYMKYSTIVIKFSIKCISYIYITNIKTYDKKNLIVEKIYIFLLQKTTIFIIDVKICTKSDSEKDLYL